MRIAYYFTTALAGAGIWVSDKLVQTHIATHYSNKGDTGICGASEAFSCADAARSEYGDLFGLPIAALGLAFYGVVLVAAALARFSPQRLRGIHDALLGAAVLSLGYSVFLAIISAVVVGKWCPFCMGLYGINLGLFVATFFGHPEGGVAGLKRLYRIPTTPAFWTLAMLMALAVFGAQASYAMRANKAADGYKKVQATLGAEKPSHHTFDDDPDLVWRGPADAKVSIIEFSDFECPYCQVFSQVIAVAKAEAGDDFRYAFKHFPMDSACNPNIKNPFHEDACAAAFGAECARQQGKFWEMHDKLFDNRAKLKADDIAGYAGDLGLDVERFKACVAEPGTVAKIQKDIADGKARGVDGTPTWFINGWRVLGGRKPDDFINMVKHAKSNAESGRHEQP